MANAIYPLTKDKWLNPGTLGVSSSTSVDMIDDTIKIALIDTGIYTYSAAHEFWISASAALVGSAQTLVTKTVSGGVFDAALAASATCQCGWRLRMNWRAIMRETRLSSTTSTVLESVILVPISNSRRRAFSHGTFG